MTYGLQDSFEDQLEGIEERIVRLRADKDILPGWLDSALEEKQRVLSAYKEACPDVFEEKAKWPDGIAGFAPAVST
jgi:hypothetical protein